MGLHCWCGLNPAAKQRGCKLQSPIVVGLAVGDVLGGVALGDDDEGLALGPIDGVSGAPAPTAPASDRRSGRVLRSPSIWAHEARRR